MLLEPLSRVSMLYGKLQGQMALAGFAEQDHTQLEALTSELVASSQIEGVTLNPASVRSSIARRLGLEYDGLLCEDHYVEGLTQVMADAVTNCRQPLTANRIFDWHHALFPTGWSGMYRIAVGQWRTGDEPMQVVSGPLGRQRVHYEAPPSKVVPAMMQELIDWCNEAEQSPFVMAAVAHLWFVTVHPFDDGKLTTSKWAKICHCSQDAALRDINDLVAKGMLAIAPRRWPQPKLYPTQYSINQISLCIKKCH